MALTGAKAEPSSAGAVQGWNKSGVGSPLLWISGIRGGIQLLKNSCFWQHLNSALILFISFSVLVHTHFKPPWSPAVHLYNYSTSAHAHSLPPSLERTKWLLNSMVVGCDCGKLKRVASQQDCLVELLAVSSRGSSLHLRSRHLPCSQPAAWQCVQQPCCWLYCRWRGELDLSQCLFLGVMLMSEF